MAPSKNGIGKNATEALRSLVKAGLELGVAEAARRLARAAAEAQKRPASSPADAVLRNTVVQDLARNARDDASGLLQMIKEVWSRGGPKDRRTAAQALGEVLSRVAPHRALQLARELATMSRSPQEAEVVGTEAIAPILEENPPLYDRVKQYLRDSEPWVRRAAITGLVAYAVRRKKYTAMTLEILLLLAEEREKDIKEAVRRAVKELSKVDWRGTSKALVAWARTDPARVKDAKRFVSAAAVDVKKDMESFVFSRIARFADGGSTKAAAKKKAPARGNGAGKRKSPPKRGTRPTGTSRKR